VWCEKREAGACVAIGPTGSMTRIFELADGIDWASVSSVERGVLDDDFVTQRSSERISARTDSRARSIANEVNPLIFTANSEHQPRTEQAKIFRAGCREGFFHRQSGDVPLRNRGAARELESFL